MSRTGASTLGTHEFMALCELLGAEPYISGNVGSGTVQEMSEWVEYLTRDGDSPMVRLRKANGRDEPWRVKYWGIGNETWGCGGNMRAEYSADLARQYATYCRDHGDNKLYRIASGASDADYKWTETLMQQSYGRLATAIIAAAEGHGLRVSIEQTGASRENELDVLSMSRNRLYDGLILSTVGMGAADVERLKVDYPVVILGERIFGGPVDHVAMPNVEASRAATRHLIERGCRRIAMVCGPLGDEVDVSSLRFTGYRQALLDAGLPVDPALVQSMDAFTMRAGARRAREMVESGLDIDGVFCATDTMAMGVLRGLADAGVAVPGQVKVIGFDNVEESEFLVPSLSTIDPDHDAMAQRAVDLLADRMERDERGRDQEEFVSSYTVVVRESTGG
ncbi:substrate-binding domain-containing protein [Streptomyces griseus]|uniref:substrate-binding domain-containing protein n=1 Tax=Streptomyces griseus TaxID=1911 RepID=UPI001F3E2803|nr:substrate-binding domain-containing protein [Streptomyces griseus]